ncbi:MAG: TetR family transcriptional regulator [Gemmatimonadota bacterium]
MVRTGRRPGPSTTRDDIVAAAAARFAAAGYDATSLRQVAADAGVDPALVRRFFVGKEGLFSDVAAALIDPAAAVAAVTGGSPETAGERLLRYFLRLLGDVRQPGPLLGLIRSAVTSEHAAAVMRRFLAERVITAIAAAMGADEPGLRGALVASQLTGLAVTRYAVQLPPLTAASVDDLVRWVAPVLQHYLTGTPIVAGHPSSGQHKRADTRGTGD